MRGLLVSAAIIGGALSWGPSVADAQTVPVSITANTLAGSVPPTIATTVSIVNTTAIVLNAALEFAPAIFEDALVTLDSAAFPETPSVRLLPGVPMTVTIERPSGTDRDDSPTLKVTIAAIEEQLPLGYVASVSIPDGVFPRPASNTWITSTTWGAGGSRTVEVPLDNTESCDSLVFPDGAIGELVAADVTLAVTGARCADDDGASVAVIELADTTPDGRTYSGSIDLTPGDPTDDMLKLSVARSTVWWIPLALMIAGGLIAYAFQYARVVSARKRAIRAKANGLTARIETVQAEWARYVGARPYEWEISGAATKARDAILKDCAIARVRWDLPAADDAELSRMEKTVDDADKAIAAWPELARRVSAMHDAFAASGSVDPLTHLDTLAERRRENAPRGTHRIAALSDIETTGVLVQELTRVAAIWPAVAIVRTAYDLFETEPATAEHAEVARHVDLHGRWYAFKSAARRAGSLDDVRVALLQFEQIHGELIARDPGAWVKPVGIEPIDPLIPPPGGFSKEARLALRSAAALTATRWTINAFQIALLILLALYAGMETLYDAKSFGSWSDFSGAFMWGLGGGALTAAIQTALHDTAAADRDQVTLDEALA